MADIHWDHEASLMRVTPVETADDAFEEWIARGTLREMVGRFLELSPGQQDDLLLRASGPDWTEEYDSNAIRELAERPEYTGAYGAYDTAQPGEDRDALREVDR